MANCIFLTLPLQNVILEVAENLSDSATRQKESKNAALELSSLSSIPGAVAHWLCEHEQIVDLSVFQMPHL